MLLLAAFVTPLLEFFDRWDSPGLSNDTEFAIFLLILGLTLVLLVSRLLAALALVFRLAKQHYRLRPERTVVARASSFDDLFIQPHSPPPLRI